MSVKIIYFVHGTTYDNASSKCSGWKQVELNELGKEQAENLGKNNKYEFDIVFTSDLIRAINSAEIALMCSIIASFYIANVIAQANRY